MQHNFNEQETPRFAKQDTTEYEKSVSRLFQRMVNKCPVQRYCFSQLAFFDLLRSY